MTRKSEQPSFGNIIKHAKAQEKPSTEVNTAKRKNVNTEKSKTINTALQLEADRDVSMTIKVPLHLRRHWVSQAKAEGTTITELVKEYLQSRYGAPGEKAS